MLTVGVVGNPNCGKTTLFNALTGARQSIGNWPGVTVERKTGTYGFAGEVVRLVDLPGVYSLGVTSESSLDERIARDYILSGDADLIVNIVDASNLERNLYLTAQIVEMRRPLVIALNMMDVARNRRIEIDVARLAERLGCPVVALVASRGEGLDALRAAIAAAGRARAVPSTQLSYVGEIEDAVAELLQVVDGAAAERGLDPRWLAVKVLEGDERTLRRSAELVAILARLKQQVAVRSGEDIDILFADARFGFANALIRECVRRSDRVGETVSDRIDRVVLNRVLGIPIFLAVIYLMFLFTINFASAFIDFFDILVGTFLVDGLGRLLAAVGSPTWLIAVIADGVGGGLRTVATFIPVVGFLFLFLSLLEDSGYMARAAFVMDRFMRAIGLPGKSFIPLIVGFGCNVPAVMATRTLENRRDRVMTVMMAPFMSCGARLPVYAMFTAAFFPMGGQNVVFALYVIGIAFAVMTGLVLRTTLLRGETSPFLMELPSYHLPTPLGVLLRTWDRLRAFLFRAGKVIVAMVVVLSFAGSLGTDGSFGNQESDRSVLAAVGKSITPVFAPMGITDDNWPATVGLFSGIFAKEAVVGTLDALYSSLGDEGGKAENAEAFSVWAGVQRAFASVPKNLAKLGPAITDPIGIGAVGSDAPGATGQPAEPGGAPAAMASRFDGHIGAFAYLLAVLLYLPCAASIAAIQREVGTVWTAFACVWTSVLAYGSAILTYQLGTFTRHPETSLAWVLIVAAVFAAGLAMLRYWGTRTMAAAVLPAE
jgi:ferrous iron transport protein B